MINRSLIAASVVLDGIDQGAQNLIESGGKLVVKSLDTNMEMRLGSLLAMELGQVSLDSSGKKVE